MITYDFSDFPYVDKPIILPIHTVLYRGISEAVKLGVTISDVLRKNVPIYLGSQNVSKAYSKGENDKLYKIAALEDLKLIDIRKVIALLPMFVNMLPNNNEGLVNVLKISLGISTLDEQIEIISQSSQISDDIKEKVIKFSKKKRYINSGIRIPITSIDASMVVILKQIFGTYYDGVIAPRLFTPFSDINYSHEEVIIFYPEKLQVITQEVDVEIEPLTNILDGTKQIFLMTDVYTGGSSNYQDKNIAFNDKKWLTKYTKYVKKHLGNLVINPELWNNSKHFITHLKHASFPGIKLSTKINGIKLNSKIKTLPETT
jgi:hypothetical protein